MGNPAGPGKMYCTSCGELIDRDSKFCTYCGAQTKDRSSPAERAGPATASDDRSFRDIRSSEETRRSYDTGTHPEEYRAHTKPEYPDQDQSEHETNDYGSPRVGVSSVDEPRWDESALRTVGVATGIGILGVVLLAVFSAIGAAILFGTQLSDIAVLGVATTIGQYLGFMGLGLWYLRHRGYDWNKVWSYLGLRTPSLREVLLVFLGWIVILVLIIIVGLIAQFFLPEPAENEGAAMLADASDNLALYFAAVLFMFLVVGPCEELLYRGVVQNRLRERLPAVPAILIASVVFAVVHVVALAGEPAAMATTVGILFVPAIVLGAVYEYTGNLVVPSLLHGLHNSFIVTILFFGPEADEAAEFISTTIVALPL